MWLRFDPSLGEWVTDLKIQEFYIGLYVLIVAAVIIVIVSCLGCLSVIQENHFLIYMVSNLFILLSRGYLCWS